MSILSRQQRQRKQSHFVLLSFTKKISFLVGCIVGLLVLLTTRYCTQMAMVTYHRGKEVAIGNSNNKKDDTNTTTSVMEEWRSILPFVTLITVVPSVLVLLAARHLLKIAIVFAATRRDENEDVDEEDPSCSSSRNNNNSDDDFVLNQCLMDHADNRLMTGCLTAIAVAWIVKGFYLFELGQLGPQDFPLIALLVLLVHGARMPSIPPPPQGAQGDGDDDSSGGEDEQQFDYYVALVN